jgi:D-sedoheptulose 7-phosphate isomerase
MSSPESITSAPGSAEPVEEAIRRVVSDAIAVCEALTDSGVTIELARIVRAVVLSLRRSGKLLLCGNGGSAADAQHLAAEMIGRFCMDRQALPAIALSDNVAALTAIGNDYCYEDVFVRGVEALGRPGDVLIGISTSGASRNVVAALETAGTLGLVTVALVGSEDCAMARAAMHAICVRGPDTARIQEGQMLLGHTLCELVEREICGS